MSIAIENRRSFDFWKEMRKKLDKASSVDEALLEVYEMLNEKRMFKYAWHAQAHLESLQHLLKLHNN